MLAYVILCGSLTSVFLFVLFAGEGRVVTLAEDDFGSLTCVMLFSILTGEGRVVTLAEDDEAPCSVPEKGLNEKASPKRSEERTQIACEKAPELVPVKDEEPERATVKAPVLNIPLIERVDVWKYEEGDNLGRTYIFKRHIMTARLTHMGVLLMATGGLHVAEEIDADIDVDRISDPAGFMFALFQAFPNEGLSVAHGAPFAEARYKEAA